MSACRHIVPVILSGGSGTRLWPLSTPARPKQYHSLIGEGTMLRQTIARVTDRARFSPPILVAGAGHEALLADELAMLPAGHAIRVILEPVARNSAPAVALAAEMVARDRPDALMLVMPSDHSIAMPEAFMAAIARLKPVVEQGALATFGIAPTGPETGYGYIRMGQAIAEGVHRVARFVEKPALAAARDMIAGGDHVWNSGIFLFRADAYLRALALHAPDMARAVHTSLLSCSPGDDVVHPDPESFAASPSDSIDYAVMERADNVVVAPVEMGWSDVGSWDALHQIAHEDSLANARRGDARHGDGQSSGSAETRGRVVAIETRDCLLIGEGARITAIGVHDLIIVSHGDDVLILPRGQSQRVKEAVDRIQSAEAASQTPG